ncbi:MAG: hypothetical protein HZB36_08405 [Candidatus Omnitrophica bacterium]|nr:hypothetical protein [Candidatus Omnitrophota bacterium]
MFKISLAMLVLFLGSGLCFAQEQVTITTYYPSPYGVYNSLLARKMAVGDTNGDGQLNSGDAPASDNDLIVKNNVGIGIATPTAAAAPNGATAGNLDANDVWLRGANAGAGRWASALATVTPYVYNYPDQTPTIYNLGAHDVCMFNGITCEDNHNGIGVLSVQVYPSAGNWYLRVYADCSDAARKVRAVCLN